MTERNDRTHLLASLLLAASFLLEPATAQDPADVGAWTPAFDLPLVTVHMAILPTGDVLHFASETGVPGIHGWIQDPETLELTNAPPPSPWNPDCSGHSYLADGRLLVAGGTRPSSHLSGAPQAFTFDPFTEKWAQVSVMAQGRWYPSLITLPEGYSIAMAGRSHVGSAENEDIELYNPDTDVWTVIGTRLLPRYPMLHVMPDGLLFMSGPDPLAETYDPRTDTWTPVATSAEPNRKEGTSVLLPAGEGWRVMLIGGGHDHDSHKHAEDGTNFEPSAKIETIDLSDATPAWTEVAPLAFPRMEHNSVLLPDGSIFVVGGTFDNGENPTPVMIPEMVRAGADSHPQMALLGVPRMYHSTALLLHDGRVAVAGANDMASGEIFSPPYLFGSETPTIESAPPLLGYGNDMTVTVSGGAHGPIDLVLMRLSAVTHSTNMGQRHVTLGTVTSGAGPTTIAGPPNANRVPPGYYQLFAVDAAGIPSMARSVRVGHEAGGFVRMGGGLRGADGIPGLDGTGTLAAGTAVAIDLVEAKPQAAMHLVIGFRDLLEPFLGGTLVPNPDIIISGLVTDRDGSLHLEGTFPAGFGPGFTFYMQAWIEDDVGPAGFAASHGLIAVTP